MPKEFWLKEIPTYNKTQAKLIARKLSNRIIALWAALMALTSLFRPSIVGLSMKLFILVAGSLTLWLILFYALRLAQYCESREKFTRATHADGEGHG